MANLKISELTAAGALTGAELVEIVQGGVNKKSTTQDIANLGGGGSGDVVGPASATDSVPVLFNGTTGKLVKNSTPTGTGDPVLATAPTLSNPVVGTQSANDNSTKAASTAYADTADALRQLIVNSAVVLTDGATIDLTAIKHTLATASSRTFTISYTGDDITIELTLSATSATQTFPATALCVSDGLSTGDNTCPLAGVSGDKYIIAIRKIGSAYYVVAKNFGQ